MPIETANNKKFSFMQIKEGRNYGIELLRIVAMLMVLILHLMGDGGLLHAETTTGANHWAAWVLEVVCYSAVDIFALISGFVGYNAKHRYASIAELWLQVFVTRIVFTVTDKLFFDKTIGLRKLILACFPITHGNMWYFTMYFCLFFFMPVLNTAINQLSEKKLRNTVIALFFVFSVLPYIWSNDTFKTLHGLTVIWLIVLYLIGGYIGKYNALAKMKKYVAFIIFCCCVLLILGIKYFFENYFTEFFGYKNNSEFLITYTSFPVTICGICMLLIFRNLKLPKFVKYFAAIVGPLSFGVYIVHSMPLIWRNFVLGKTVCYNQLSAPVMILAVLGTALLLFISCAVIDFVRARLFDLLKVKKILANIENKLIKE